MKSRWIKPGLMAIVITLLLAACQTLPELITKNLTRNDPSEGIGLTKNNPIDNMVMVYVPAGDFLMGSEAEEAFSDEKPEHMVYLRDYWIYQTEVTNQQYNQCLQPGACTSARKVYSNDDHPATLVFRRDGHKYCK